MYVRYDGSINATQEIDQMLSSTLSADEQQTVEDELEQLVFQAQQEKTALSGSQPAAKLPSVPTNIPTPASSDSTTVVNTSPERQAILEGL